MSKISRRDFLTGAAAVAAELAVPSAVSAAAARPKIAIVIDDMGPEAERPDLAIDLPAEVTLSFMPFASNPAKQSEYVERLREQTKEALFAGHELLLHMPMEPKGDADPGPGALKVGMSSGKIRRLLEAALDIFGGRIAGMNNHEGSRFTADPDGMQTVVEVLKERGLFLLDSRTDKDTVACKVARANDLPTISRKVFLDDTQTPEAIIAQLAATEKAAMENGYAAAIGHPHPATMKVLKAWIPHARARGYEIVSLSELVNEKKTPKQQLSLCGPPPPHP